MDYTISTLACFFSVNWTLESDDMLEEQSKSPYPSNMPKDLEKV